MPLSSTQLAALVERAKAKAPPVVSPPPPRPPRRPKPAPPATARAVPKPQPVVDAAPAATIPAPPPPQSGPAAEAEDFPIGWELRKESWHFHRRFHAIFRRPMRCGEYSQLLWQIRRGTAEHLWEDAWRVTLPDGSRTLPVRATAWRLITILPKHWQPPPLPAQADAEPLVRPKPAEA